MKHQVRRSTFLLPAFAVAMALVLSSAPAHAQRGALAGTLIDTDGNPVGKHQLILHPLAGGSPIKLKTKASGAFAHSFLIPGQYRITSSDENAYLSHFDIVAGQQGGSEVSRWSSDAHPESGLPPFQIYLAQKTTMTLTVSDQAHRNRVRQAVATAAVAGPMQAAVDRYDAGDMEGTLEEAQRVLDQQPGLAYGHFLRGIALTKLGRSEEAESALRTAVELNAELPDAAGALGTLLLQRATELEATDGERAQAALSEAAGLLEKQAGMSDPPPSAILANWAMALERSGEIQGAIGVFERLIEADPSNEAAYYNLADLHRKAGDEEKALGILEKIPSTATNGSSAQVIYNMAVKAFNAGDYEKTLSTLERTGQVDPDFALAHHLRGRVFLAQEDYEGAIRELSRFIELAPDHPSASEDQAILDSLKSMGGG